ncbi:b-cell receptor-associated protein [Tyrophagus putrescentiae]|nr:b-cell receptor-associated protein [Tyrophagus putrescentiae]
MSLQWTLVAAFLYVEIAIIFIFLLSIIKPKIWRSFFKSRFIQALAAQSNLYLVALIGILFLFFADSIREFHKYSGRVRKDENTQLATHYEDQMRLFRGQRNFYISGFSLFCLFIIKRLATLISQQAQYQAEAEASRRQAENISKHVENLTSEAASAASSKTSKKDSGNESLLLDMKVKMAELVEKNEKLEKSLQAMKKQAEATNKEYDRLTGEYAELQNKYDKINQNRDR